MFRDKLAREIEEVERYLDDSQPVLLDQRIQVHVYCIAALLRKIFTRIHEANKTFQIKVKEVGKEILSIRDVPMGRVLNSILHYAEFRPHLMPPDGAGKISILSDRDGGLLHRSLSVREFLEVARQVAESDDAVAGGLLRYVTKKLDKVVHTGKLSMLDGQDLAEALMDVFEIVRNLGWQNVVGGTLAIQKIEIVKRKNSVEPFTERIEIVDVEYKVLFEKLFAVWHYIQIGRQFDTRDEKRVIVIESYSNTDDELGPCMAFIYIDDISALLRRLEQRACQAD